MSTQAASSDKVIIAAADTLITSAQTYPVTAVLLTVGEGSDHTEGDEIRFICTGGSPIEVVDANGARVGFCPGNGQAVVVAELDGDPGQFSFDTIVAPLAAHQASPSAAQAWAVLVANGLVKAE